MSVLDFMKSAASRALGKSKHKHLRCVGKSKTHRTCDKCGKTDLAGTVVFERADGAKVYYGSECAKMRDGADGADGAHGFAIEKWLSYSGVYHREDQHTYPTEQAAEEKVAELERFHGWQNPAPRYRIVPERAKTECAKTSDTAGYEQPAYFASKEDAESASMYYEPAAHFQYGWLLERQVVRPATLYIDANRKEWRWSAGEFASVGVAHGRDQPIGRRDKASNNAGYVRMGVQSEDDAAGDGPFLYDERSAAYRKAVALELVKRFKLTHENSITTVDHPRVAKAIDGYRLGQFEPWEAADYLFRALIKQPDGRMIMGKPRS